MISNFVTVTVWFLKNLDILHIVLVMSTYITKELN